MFGDIFEDILFGEEVFAQNKWWLRIKYFRDGFYLVVDSNAIMPAPILLVKQSDKDRKYQEILFRKFKIL